MSALEIRSNGHIFIAGTRGSTAANSPFEARAILKEAGFWWHGGPCKPGCKACKFKVPKMWWTAEPARAARLKAYCDPKALAALAPIFAQLEKSHQVDANIDLPCPDGLAYDGFQKAGVAFVLEAFKSFRGALIADEMGLGKTVQALGVMNEAVNPTNGTIDSYYAAVFCPKSLVLNWKREAEKWLGKSWQVLTHEDYFDGEEPPLWNIANVLLIWPYSQVEKFPKFTAQDTGVPPYVVESPLELDLLVFDESQYIKNPEAARTRECIDHVEVVSGKREVVAGRIQSQAKHTLFLSGTPLLNRPLELQTILIALDPSFHGFWFLKQFCNAHKNSQGHWDFSGSSNLGELQNIMRSKFMVRRLKKDVYKDLPAKRRSLIPLELNSEAKAALKLVDTEPSFEESVTKMESKRPWGHPAQVRQQLAMAKVDKVVEFVKDLLENTQKVIVFGFTISAMEQIQEALFPGYGARLIIGDTSMAYRQEAVEAFQTDKACRVLVGGYGPMGVGLTLTASSTVVMSEPAWTPAEVSQAEDRAHRRGQTEMVNCYHLVWDGTLEAKMMKMIVAKQDIADRVLDKDTEIKMTIEPSPIPSHKAYHPTPGMEVRTFFMTPEEKALIHRALRHLASRCDGAVGVDGQGFNKLDSTFGKSLASAPSLSDKQAHFGKKLVKKYRTQLEAAGISLATLDGI